MLNSIRLKSRLALAIVAAGLAAVAMAAPATAEFTEPYEEQCSGLPIEAAGSGVGDFFWQTGAAEFSAADAAEACPTFQPTEVTYSASSSGAGLAAFRGSRDPEIRLAGTAEAPGPLELAIMEEGEFFTSDDDAELRTIPQFAASVAVIVNFPDGCSVPAESESAIGEGSTQRFQVSNATLEAAMAGSSSVDTWGELLPDISGEGCAAKPVERVVRDERAGATFVLKQWLQTVNAKRGWQLLASPVLNTVWPKSSVNLVRAEGSSESGNVDEAATVAATDGSIGYADLNTARLQGFSESAGKDDDNYWIPLHNGSGALAEPSQFAVTSGSTGANCTAATFANVPSGEDPTGESWRQVSAAGTEAGYPLCTLVYAMAWDDSADAYGSAEEEQGRQRMVRDFLGYQLASRGQAAARSADVTKLPSAILEIARQGQQQLGWDKP